VRQRRPGRRAGLGDLLFATASAIFPLRGLCGGGGRQGQLSAAVVVRCGGLLGGSGLLGCLLRRLVLLQDHGSPATLFSGWSSSLPEYGYCISSRSFCAALCFFILSSMSFICIRTCRSVGMSRTKGCFNSWSVYGLWW
jgi:hypothetical protein